MTTLVLENNRLLKNDEMITDIHSFCSELSIEDEITLVLKSHDISYHFCPVKKAARYIKSAEYSHQHWVGEKLISHRIVLQPFSPSQLLIAGIMPSSFMQKVIQLMALKDWSLKGTYLWSDSIMQIYQPIPMGWVLIFHDNQLFVSQNHILKFSHDCESSLVQELPKVLRYIKRFGYEIDSPITLLSNDNISGDLPHCVALEIRKTTDWQPQGLKVHIPEFKKHHRYYSWPKKIKMAAKTATAVFIITTIYTVFEVASFFRQEQHVTLQILSLSPTKSLTPNTIDAFKHYCHLIKGRQNPLILLRRLIPHFKDEAVVTYLHWTPEQLTLQLELHPAAAMDQFWQNIRSQLLDYQISWREDENEPLKGVLTIHTNSIHDTTL